MNLKPESNQPKRSAMASTKADLRELRGNSQATVQEIQAFLRELKGKNPQEMLGMVASSNLFRSLLLSTAIVAGGILLFTAIPYFMADSEPPVAEKAAEEPGKTATPEAPAPEPEVPLADETDPIDSLGIGEELPAEPGVNPLESTGDDFLKDLE